MCNGVAPVDTPIDQDSSLDKMHLSVKWGLELGEWGWTLCGVRRQLVGNGGAADATCSECLSRASSYGY